jgi:pyruvate-formate lyase-activating enzyme
MAASRSGAPETPALSVLDHDRNASAMRYVYPVVSRRAGGVSIGINLNVNNACNWACIYCQVPDLTRGGPPPVDVDLLAAELSRLLDEVLVGDFLLRRVPADMRRLADVAFSGNGEPTSSEEFLAAADVVISALQRRGLAGRLPIRVITNGSLLHRPAVIKALVQLGAHGGEVWFKIDRASEPGMLAVNQTAVSLARVERNLRSASKVIPVWVQTCWFGVDGVAPSVTESDAYINLVAKLRESIAGVHLYGIARPSLQPGGERLTRLPAAVLDALAARLKEIGVTATVSE